VEGGQQECGAAHAHAMQEEAMTVLSMRYCGAASRAFSCARRQVGIYRNSRVPRHGGNTSPGAPGAFQVPRRQGWNCSSANRHGNGDAANRHACPPCCCIEPSRGRRKRRQTHEERGMPVSAREGR